MRTALPDLNAELLLTELEAGALGTAALLSDDLLTLEPLPIMRAKAMRKLVAAGTFDDRPAVAAALLKLLENRSVSAYRQYRRAPQQWAQYMADYDVAFKTLGQQQADALPRPLKTGFKYREAKAQTEWDKLVATAARELHGMGELRGTTLDNRATVAARNNEDRETVRARTMRDALVLRVIDGLAPITTQVTVQQVRAGLSWHERVIADMQVCARAGLPVPVARGHTLADIPLHMRPEP